MTELSHRYNKGKPQLSYLLDIPYAARQVSAVFEFGSKKYARHNWKLGLHHNALVDSLMRHLLDHHNGHDCDAESGLPNLAHAAWNALVLLEQSQRKDLDDRHKPDTEDAHEVTSDGVLRWSDGFGPEVASPEEDHY